mgnify:CR=1 FL=1
MIRPFTFAITLVLCLGSMDQAFGQSIATFGQKMAVSRNKIVEWVGASEGLNDAVGLAGDAIVGLSDNIDTLVDGAQFLAVLMAGRLSGSLATATAAKLSALGQTLAYQAALARLAGVSGTAATAQLAMGAAVRTATGAMALLGGPVGAAVVAAGGIYYFREELGLVQPKIESVTSTVDALTDSINMNSEAALKNGISKLSADIADLQRAAQTARAERDAIQMQALGRAMSASAQALARGGIRQWKPCGKSKQRLPATTRLLSSLRIAWNRWAKAA